ncbi:hypothetical protein DPMN_018864 [Dreissena polymorpha]|uniref:Uncharacterized protein n=1 Tax=Dreissena polymorpha TaxID=45954 RepID=A0A9D4S9M0_DREPO|nr:hypothetical protein DPMN_018864 [Dreissena polymorpha]
MPKYLVVKAVAQGGDPVTSQTPTEKRATSSCSKNNRTSCLISHPMPPILLNRLKRRTEELLAKSRSD